MENSIFVILRAQGWEGPDHTPGDGQEFYRRQVSEGDPGFGDRMTMRAGRLYYTTTGENGPVTTDVTEQYHSEG